MRQGKTADRDIERAIQDLLSYDVSVDSSKITIEVENDTAVLSGSVPTYWDRQSAEIDALYAPGIKRVINNLSVVSPGRGDGAADESIRIAIEASLSQNPDMTYSDMYVAVKHGIVTLEGTVNDHWKKLRAAELAADVSGVVGVNNRLAIVAFEDIDDETIAEQVIRSLGLKGIDVNAIDIEVVSGKVILSGTVPSRGVIAKAATLAKEVPGVKEVQNELFVI